jgi:hypothetical protein
VVVHCEQINRRRRKKISIIGEVPIDDVDEAKPDVAHRWTATGEALLFGVSVVAGVDSMVIADNVVVQGGFVSSKKLGIKGKVEARHISIFLVLLFHLFMTDLLRLR